MGRRVSIAAALCLAGALACARTVAADPPETAPVLDALLGERRTTVTLESLLAEPLAAGEAFAVREVGRDARTSQHVVWIRDAEDPHRHDAHELIVVMLRGYGSMRLGDETRPVGPGSILYVPRGVVHAFRNESGAPAAAYAIYSPPFDGKDRVAPDAARAAGAAR